MSVSGRDRTWNAEAIPALIEGLQQKEERVRIEASQTLLMTGPVAKAAIPALKKLLDDPKSAVRLEAALTLVGIDPKEAGGTVPALTEGLKADDRNAVRAAKALAALGPVAKDAVPELVKHFDAKAPLLQLYAAEAAARIEPAQAPKAVEVLVGLLQNKKYKSNTVRSYALIALQRIGTPAKSAMPTLTTLLNDKGPFQADVALAMVLIDPDGAKPAFEWIRSALGKESLDEDTHDLLERLPEFGKKASPLMPELIAMLKAKPFFYRKQAILTLSAIGPDAKDALPELKKLAEGDPRQDIRKLAAEAVKKIEK